MKWIITRDHTEENQQLSAVGTCKGMGTVRSGQGEQVVGRALVRSVPAEALQPLIAELVKGLNYEFQLLDDDGEPMLDGFCLDLYQQDGDSALEPLDHFASLYGTTIMRYRPVGMPKWATL